MEETKQKLLDFLSHFDYPIYKLIPDNKAPWKIKSLNTNRSLDECLALNDEYPCWLYFTPNWGFGLVNQIGEQIRFSKDVIPNEWHMCAFVLDFDVKDVEWLTMDALELSLMDKIEHTNIKPTYLIKSWGWYHVYWIIKKEDRELAFQAYGWDMLKISAQLQKNRWGDKWARVSTNPCSLIRLPYSYHRKTGQRKMVDIVWSSWIFTTLTDIDNSMKHIASLEEAQKNIKKTQVNVWVFKFKEIDDIPMPVMLEKLKNYPRTIEWDTQTMWIEWTQVVIYSEKKGTLRRNSYKYWKWENKIKCFYDWPLEVSPIGKWYQFLYWYFLKDWKQISDFLRKEFDIDLSVKDRWLGQVKQRIEVWDYTVVFCTWWVVLETEKKDKSWGTVITSTVLFRNSLEILWKWYTKVKNIWESDVPIRVYITMVDWVEQLLQLSDSKKTHNRHYKNLWFYGQDNDLWLFFNALDKSPEIEEKVIYDLSGFYDNNVILGDNVVVWNKEDCYILNKNVIEVTKATNITVAEYLDKFLQLYDEELAIPIFLQSLALAGMNLRQWLEIYPALLLSWWTWSGKSSIMRNMKTMIGYSAESRVYSLPNTSPQPLKTYASDYSVLFLEELTNSINPLSEELIRNIANRNRASRWEIDGNIQFPLRSPVFIVWERTFKGESINNRFVTIMIASKYWKPGTKHLVNELNEYTAYEDVYRILSWYESKEISDMAMAYSQKLSAEWFNSRMADARSFIFVMNDIFWINIPEAKLRKFAESHLNRVGLWDKKIQNYRTAMKNTLVKLSTKRSLIVTAEDVDGTNEKWWRAKDRYTRIDFLFLDNEAYEKERWLINMAIQEINDELWEETIIISCDTISITLDNLMSNGKLVNEVTIKMEPWVESTMLMIPPYAKVWFRSNLR